MPATNPKHALRLIESVAQKSLFLIAPGGQPWSLVAASLSGCGYEVKWIESVEEGFFALLRAKPQYLVFAEELFDGEGIQVLELVRRMESLTGILVIGVLNGENASTRRRYMEAGADDVLAMPLEAGLLETALEVRHQRLEEYAHLAIIKEQRRFAEDLHDGLQHTLVEAKFSLLSLIKNSSRFDELTPELNRVVDVLSSAIEETRGLAQNKFPPILEKAGLVGAIQNLLEGIAGKGMPHTTFSHSLSENPSPAIALSLYRISQEALSNIFKYAHASQIDFRLEHPGPGWVQLTIDDNGVGFELSRILKGNGLVNMQNRISAQGGALKIRSTPGKGAQITVTCPLGIHEMA